MVVSEFEETLDKAMFKDPRDYAIANACGKAKEVTDRRPILNMPYSGLGLGLAPCPDFMLHDSVTALIGLRLGLGNIAVLSLHISRFLRT